MEIYSHSRLTTFENCPLKFKYKYIDKIISLEKSIEAFVGDIVHKTLEWIYKQVKKNKVPTIDEAISYYATEWEDNYTPNIIIIRKELTSKDYFNKGVEFILNYYTKHKPFDDNTLEIEKKIVMNLDEEGKYKFQGFIDRLVHNLEKDEYEIHDYKTGNNLPSKEKIEQDKQLALYSIAIKELVGDKDVVLVWHYLAHNQKICSKRTNKQIQDLRKETIELIKKIESATKFPAYISKLCDWCEYKNVCSAWPEKNVQRKLPTEELDIWN